MGKLEVINHPLIQHKLSILRRTDTSTKAFRELVDEIAMLMGYEVLRDLPLEDVEIETPITKTVQKQLAGKKLAIVPILRAGIGMVDGLLSLVPAAKVGHIGMYRDEETLQPVEYLVKLPEDINQYRMDDYAQYLYQEKGTELTHLPLEMVQKAIKETDLI